MHTSYDREIPMHGIRDTAGHRARSRENASYERRVKQAVGTAAARKRAKMACMRQHPNFKRNLIYSKTRFS